MKYQRSEIYSIAKLKKRGWTRALIEKYLPEPDQTRINPRSPKRPGMKFYSKWIVEKTERAPIFVRAMRAARAQSTRMKQAQKEQIAQPELSQLTRVPERESKPTDCAAPAQDKG